MKIKDLHNLSDEIKKLEADKNEIHQMLIETRYWTVLFNLAANGGYNVNFLHHQLRENLLMGALIKACNPYCFDPFLSISEKGVCIEKDGRIVESFERLVKVLEANRV